MATRAKRLKPSEMEAIAREATIGEVRVEEFLEKTRNRAGQP